MPRELIIYCDESTKRGEYFSNFYGGALVRSRDIDFVRARLTQTKTDLGFLGEVKFTKITEKYSDKYIELSNDFLDLVAQDKIKMRVMFTQNRHIPIGLTKEQLENSYSMLYYQFIKHAFGLPYCNKDNIQVDLRIFLDQIPENKEKAERLRHFICALSNNPQFRRAQLRISRENVTDVSSHDHVVMQCVDIVLGCMQFRLNNRHLTKPPGQRTRAKRTRAKEKVYKAIISRIRTIHPNFNIGISTGDCGDVANRWLQPYRHWLFVPSERLTDDTLSKRGKR